MESKAGFFGPWLNPDGFFEPAWVAQDHGSFLLLVQKSGEKTTGWM